jgi:hypothetical protein
MRSRTAKKMFAILAFAVFTINSQAQNDTTETRLKFFEPAPTLHKGRLIGLTTSLGVAYTGTMIGLHQIWYKDVPKSRFQFFDDAKEWQQVDKMGHMHTAYFESVWATKMLKWAGVNHKKASIYGALMGFTFQSSIEIFDAFSEKWGWSWTDIAANAVGSGLALSQNLAWGEQRIRTKYSFHEVVHPDQQLLERAQNLYGQSKLERLIKDYNGLAIWVSVTPTMFMKNPQRAKWLAVSAGYMGSGMYGGFDNSWTDADGNRIERFDIERYRRFFFSLDVDFERIKTEKHGLKTLFTVLNIIKVPFPAMEFNTKGEVVFHPMFYLNWNRPIVLKK